MQKIKSLAFVFLLAVLAACTPEFIAPQVEQKSEDGVIRLRSSSSINEKEPIIVVNGKIVERELLYQMDPNKIASISVIKKPSANAIYGEKAKNGVVIITLKD